MAVQVNVLLVALGYFVYDTIGCALIEEDRANAAHHVCSIAAVAVGIFRLHVRSLFSSACILWPDDSSQDVLIPPDVHAERDGAGVLPAHDGGHQPLPAWPLLSEGAAGVSGVPRACARD